MAPPILFHLLLRLLVGQYDHFTFPGAVPRTFVGSVLLAWVSDLVLRMGSRFGIFEDKFDIQIIGEPRLVRLACKWCSSSALSANGPRQCQRCRTRFPSARRNKTLWTASWLHVRAPVNHSVSPPVLDKPYLATHVRTSTW